MYSVGEIIVTKKKHPCGGNAWEVVRTGADIKLKCVTCGRYVFMSADKLKKASAKSDGGNK